MIGNVTPFAPAAAMSAFKSGSICPLTSTPFVVYDKSPGVYSAGVILCDLLTTTHRLDGSVVDRRFLSKLGTTGFSGSCLVCPVVLIVETAVVALGVAAFGVKKRSPSTMPTIVNTVKMMNM